jgi:hypothetical protein
MKIEIHGLSVSEACASDTLRFVCDCQEAAFGVMERLAERNTAFQFSPPLASLSKRHEVIINATEMDRHTAQNLIARVVNQPPRKR